MKTCLKKREGYVCCLNAGSFVLYEAEDFYMKPKTAIGRDKRTVEEKAVDFFL